MTEDDGPDLHAWLDNPDVIRALIEAGAGASEITRLVLAGADPNARDWSRQTPLHRVARFAASVEAVAALIEAGADPDARDRWGRTPLHEVSGRSSGNSDITTALTRAGADVNARDRYGRTPLHLAAGSTANPGIASTLARLGADPDARDRDGRPPLEVARRAGHGAVIQALEDEKSQASDSAAPAEPGSDSPSSPAM